MSLFRVYDLDECAASDGYPPAWHQTIKHVVRAAADHRCIRCKHPYTAGAGEWSPCDERCAHGGPARSLDHPFLKLATGVTTGELIRDARHDGWARVVEARWRILTVHHLDQDKGNCRWWNLAALCQRCHLRVQGRVVMARVWPWEHSDWFKPYAAGYYAWTYLGQDLTRSETLDRLDELLELERQDTPA